jgi:hypothetical protein
MTDPDEAQLSKLAKKMLATPHKKRDESKVGKIKRNASDSQKAKESSAKR